ncbi:MAG TPA: LLM class flavin-dependent oxidoreductase [Actinomycetota bacterium]|jgi:probable F420-dependent oxidoreductase
MRFGLALPHYDFSLPGGEPVSFRRVVEHAQLAERLGFDSVWVSDHFFYTFARYGGDERPLGSLEPMTALAGIAALTERVRIGTLVLCAPFRHPAILAKMATTIDGISGGRLDLGLGAGWLREEFDAFGYPFGTLGERFANLEDTLRALGALFGDEPATLEVGDVRLHEASLLPGTIQKPHPPIWLGGKGGDRLLSLVARFADGWNTVWRRTIDDYRANLDGVRRACDAADRDPDTFRRSVGLYALVAEDERGVTALLDEARDGFPGDALRDETRETWCADTLSGTPEQVIDRVRAFQDLGVEELIVAPWVLPFAVPHPEVVQLFAHAVIEPLRSA